MTKLPSEGAYQKAFPYRPPGRMAPRSLMETLKTRERPAVARNQLVADSRTRQVSRTCSSVFDEPPAEDRVARVFDAVNLGSGDRVDPVVGHQPVLSRKAAREQCRVAHGGVGCGLAIVDVGVHDAGSP